MTTPISFVAAMKNFFGLRLNQTLTEFAAELKTLTQTDREFFRQGLTPIKLT